MDYSVFYWQGKYHVGYITKNVRCCKFSFEFENDANRCLERIRAEDKERATRQLTLGAYMPIKTPSTSVVTSNIKSIVTLTRASITAALLREGVQMLKIERFLAWHEQHRHIWKKFEAEALKLADGGTKGYGAMAIINRIRWDDKSIQKGSEDEFKIPNDYQPYYARIFLWMHPEHAGFFVTKPLGRN